MRPVFCILTTLFLMLTLNLPTSEAQNSSQWSLPNGAIASLGKGSVYALAYSADRDRSRLAVAGYEEIWIYDGQNPADSVSIKLDGGTRAVKSVAFSPDGETLASGSRGGVHLWNATTHELKKTLKHEKGVLSIAFSPDPDSSLLASGSSDNTVRIWNATDGTLVHKLTGHTDAVNSVAFRRDGTLASGSSDGTVRLWNPTEGTLINTLEDTRTGYDDAVNSVAFSPDGETLAVGNQSETVRLWDTTDTTRVPRIDGLIGHTDEVNSVAFRRDGTLASGSSDGTVRLWDPTEGTLINTLTGHDDEVNSVAFSPDGTLASGGWDDNVFLWRITPSTRLIHATTTSFSRDKGVEAVNFTDFSENIISDVALTKNATYFVLNLQFLKLTFTAGATYTYGPCLITLDIPGVPDKPLDGWDSTNRLITHPPYFMYPLLSAQQRIDAVNDKFQWNTQEVIIGAIAAGGGGAAAAKVKLLLPITKVGRNFVLNIGSRFQILLPQAAELKEITSRFIISKVTGKAANYLTATGLNTVFASEPIKQDQHREEATIEEQILAFTADPFLILQPSPDWNFQFPPVSDSRYLFRIPKRMENIRITVEQVYSRQTGNKEPMAFTAEFGAVWKLLAAASAAPHAQLMSLADYPPFQELPPEAQAYLRQHFGGTMNVNTEQWQIPEETTLLPNYPNPFNPETWIPYQLANPADVRVTIYDTNGRVVRDLDLGHKRAGIYQSRARAAYWDGKNAQGEPVASGVYFYTLSTESTRDPVTAGEFTATRKMLIRK